MTTNTTICGITIWHDSSNVGQNWRTIDCRDIPANIREEIAAEILDGGKNHCDQFTASNGLSYRW